MSTTEPQAPTAPAPSATAEPRASATLPSRRYRPGEIAIRGAVIVAALIVVALFSTQWDRWVGGAIRQETDDAYVRGTVTPLSAQVDGYVKHVAVNDFDRVKAGDLLIEIDDSVYRAKVDQAAADLDAAQATIANIKARKETQHELVAEAESAVAEAQADALRTKQEADRQRALLATTFGTEQKVEQAVADEKRFAATVAHNQEALDEQRRQFAVLDTQESQLRADAKSKQAALDLARINLGYCRIVAPVSGEVSERGVYDGQYVHGGSEVISIVPLDNLWVIANYKETQLTHVAIGQRAEIRVDTFPGTVVPAMVESIAPASGSQFSLLPPDNATGNFTKVVQRIPVKLHIGADNPLAGRLLPGMSVETTILTDTKPSSP
ncbi:MAG TPA: HlyD family secretion protein [Stellaceae bacterium]|jgi:membrane fusion protein (multidrug efflux system)|nr:HlyD family secretion protein [Stellaceae bacterium]